MKTRNGLKTPFRYYPINFVKNKCVLKSQLIKVDYDHVVDKGIYAYRSLNTAVGYARDMHAWTRTNNYIVVKAIIPKFSNYYIGCYGDIVSNKMIITDEVRWPI